jgi:hypothetical protein
MNSSYSNILKLFCFALIIKLSLIPIAYLFVHLNISHKKEIKNPLEIYHNHDSGWYAYIVKNGYNSVKTDTNNDTNKISKYQHYAFFPLLPFLTFVAANLFGGNFYIAYFLLNILFLFGLIFYYYKYLIELEYSHRFAYRYLSIFLVFPVWLHLYFFYTESLYMLLLLACFYYIKINKLYYFFLSSSMLILCRPNGIITLLPLFLYYLYNEKISLKYFLFNLEKYKSVIISFLLPCFTFAFWLYIQYLYTGEAFMFSIAQIAWGKKFVFPLLGLFTMGYWQMQAMSVYAVVLMLLLLLFFKKFKLYETVFMWMNILLPLSAGSAISIARYSIVQFPLYLQIFKKIENLKPIYFLLTLFAFIILSCITFLLWLNSDGFMF